MESAGSLPNCLKSKRVARGWSQAELAERAGISRTAVSAIEKHRLVPSVAAAIALSRVLQCSVEELFGPCDPGSAGGDWAWAPPRPNWRYWEAEVGGRVLWYPVESSGVTSSLPHDNRTDETAVPKDPSPLLRQTLVVACCDPAAGLLSTLYGRMTGYRLIVIPRSSQQSLDLLGRGLVHVAGLHLTSDSEDRNGLAVRTKLGGGYRLLGVAKWQEGLAVARAQNVKSIRSALKSKLRWIGREPGSGARQCMDELLANHAPIRRIARDHRGVADAIRSGWADAGVCLRLTCEESGLTFFGLREERFELTYAQSSENDPRVQALLRVVRSAEYRGLLSSLPGYDSSVAGDVQCVN